MSIDQSRALLRTAADYRRLVSSSSNSNSERASDNLLGYLYPHGEPVNAPATPGMAGFVTDYLANFPLGDTTDGAGPTYQQYQSIMQCFAPASVPVLATRNPSG